MGTVKPGIESAKLFGKDHDIPIIRFRDEGDPFHLTEVLRLGQDNPHSIPFRTGAAVLDRVGAVASFHGGGLVTDKPDSPHLEAARSRAQFLIAIAANDDARSPNDKNVLKETFAKANLAAEIEVYADAAHGWCPPDSRVYNEPQAEKAWSRLLVLYGKALA